MPGLSLSLCVANQRQATSSQIRQGADRDLCRRASRSLFLTLPSADRWRCPAPARRRSTARTASTRIRYSTTEGRRRTRTGAGTSPGPPGRRSTGRSTSGGGDDDVPAPVHRLRCTHPDQEAEAAAMRPMRQGGGARLLALALPDVSRRDARVPPQRLPQEPQAHPREARGATRREGAVRRQQRRRHDVVLRPQRQLHRVGRVVDRPCVQLRELTMSGRTIGNLILMTLICVVVFVVFIVFMAVRPTKASAQNFQREAELSDLARPYHPATGLDLISPEAVTCS